MDQFTNLLKYGPHIYNVVMDHWSIIWTHWTALNTNANVLLRCANMSFFHQNVMMPRPCGFCQEWLGGMGRTALTCKECTMTVHK